MGADTNRTQSLLYQALGSALGSGGRIRTGDLRVMSPTSCHCSTPRRGKAATTYCPSGAPASIVGAGALHDRVRDGNGWSHPARVTAFGGPGPPGPGIA